MKMIFFACQQIGVDCIKYALDCGVEVPVVYSYELIMDKTYGYDSVSEFCLKNNIPVVLNGKANIKDIFDHHPDMIVSAYYRKILKSDVFQIPSLGTVNIHPSLLPEYRGPIPTVWAILQGKKKTGVTLHYIDKGVDTGDIIFQEEILISNDDTGYSLCRKCMDSGVDLFKKMIDKILSGGELPRDPQPRGGSYYGSMDDDMRKVNWKMSVDFLVNQCRAFTRPYMGVEAKLLNKRILIWKASKVDDPHVPVQKPGRIVDIRDGKYVVTMADGLVELNDIEFFPAMNEIEKDIYFRIGLEFS